MKSNILISPLNWGLGHSTRCIPIIRCLIERGHDVSIASDGEALFLMKKEFPGLKSFELPQLRIRYPRRFRTLFWLNQISKLNNWIRADQTRVQELCRKFSFSHIISDNRYGVLYKGCQNVLITHQLHLQIPLPFKRAASYYLHKYIKRFDFCLIPDYKENQNLAGELCHPPLKIPTVYTGPYSRFKSIQSELKYDMLAVVSGPEPYRSGFERKITEQLINADIKTIIVRGVPGSETIKKLNSNTCIADLLGSSKLNKVIAESALIVSRAGYSSILDYHCLSKKALLIPTPGQPEQKYLAIWNKDHPLFYFQEESKLDVLSARNILLSREHYPIRGFKNDFEFVKQIGL